MDKQKAIIRESAAHLAAAANRALDAFVDKRVEQEPHLTDRMLGRIEEAMNGFQTKGVVWTAKTLTDHAPRAQESKYGADFIGVLEINIANYSVKKGFLAQAKRLTKPAFMRSDEFKRLQHQCDKMLESTPDSYVFLYSRAGIRILPAVAVLASTNRDLDNLYSRSVKRFFEDHFECFIGDRRINAPSIKVLEKLRQDYDARRLLYLEAIEESPTFEMPFDSSQS